ncbi:MAG: hypothetical protein ACM3XS_01655 [Bacteroidota bacterium]
MTGGHPAEGFEDDPDAVVIEEKIKLREKDRIEKAKAQTANLLGYLIVGGFVGSALLTLATGLWGTRLGSDEVCDLLKTITTTFGVPLGFVLGFYYGVAKRQ